MSANLKGSRVGLIHVIDPTPARAASDFANFQMRKFSATMAFEPFCFCFGIDHRGTGEAVEPRPIILQLSIRSRRSQQAAYRDVFIQIRPVDADAFADEPPIVALLRCSV
jgi:hypothetical protein